MDDPISALDANVKKKIFQNVFMGQLKDKTRVLVTHAVDFLHLVDNIVLFKDGQVILQGKYEDIKDDPYLIQIMSIHKSHQKEQHKLVDDIKKTEEKKKEASESENEDSENEQLVDTSHVDPETAVEDSLLDQSAAQHLSDGEESEKE